MNMALTGTTRFWLLGFALAGFGGLVACTTDKADPGVSGGTTSSTSGSGGSTTGSSGTDTSASGGSNSTTGETTTTGSGGTSSGSTKCAVSVALDSSAPGIANFDDYDGAADLSTWSFALGGDVALGVFAGPFGYGDDHTDASGNEAPETFEMVDGYDSTYALSISDSESTDYGGGMGIWMSDCLNASAFSGVSFWVRGNAPTGEAKFTILMEESTPEADGGTCAGTSDECVHPSFTFPVTDTWTQIQAAWSDFVAGDAKGISVHPDGTNIWQVQYGIDLDWQPDDSGEYQPIAAAYELAVDDLNFY